MPGTTWETAEAISGRSGTIAGDASSASQWWVFTGEDGFAYDFTFSASLTGYSWVGGTGLDWSTAVQFLNGTIGRIQGGTTPVHFQIGYSDGPFTATWTAIPNYSPETAQPVSAAAGSLDHVARSWYVFTPEPGMLYTFHCSQDVSEGQIWLDGTSDSSTYKALYRDVLVAGGSQPLYLRSDTTGTLTWDSEPDPDPSPNDTWQTAVVIDGSTSGSVDYDDYHLDGEEWFLLNVTPGAFYLVTVSEPDGYVESYRPDYDGGDPHYLSYGYMPDGPLGLQVDEGTAEYYLKVYPSSSGATGTMSWSMEGVEPPPYVVANDLQQNAIPIDVTVDGSVAYDNTGATGAPDDNEDIRSIWFSFTSASSPTRFTATATPPLADDYAKPIITVLNPDGVQLARGFSEATTEVSASVVLPANTIGYVRLAFPFGVPTNWSQGALDWTTTVVPANALPDHALDISATPRLAITFDAGTSATSPSVRWFTHTPTQDGPFLAVLGDATLNPSAAKVYVYAADGTYLGYADYRHAGAPTSRFVRAVKAGEPLTIKVSSDAGTPVLLRWGVPTAGDEATFLDWQDSTAGTFNNTGWYAYGGALKPGGVTWERSDDESGGRHYVSESWAFHYQGQPPLGDAPYEGGADNSNIPGLVAEVEAGTGGTQCGMAISDTKDRDAGDLGSSARTPSPGVSVDGAPQSVGYSIGVGQAPVYWVAIDNPDGQNDVIDGGTYSQNHVTLDFGYWASGFSEADESSPMVAYAPIYYSGYYYQAGNGDFLNWVSDKAIQWSDGTVGVPTTQKAMIFTCRVASTGDSPCTVDFISVAGNPGTGYQSPGVFRGGEVIKSIAVGPSNTAGSDVEISYANPGVSDLPWTPGQTYRIAALVSGYSIPPSGNFNMDIDTTSAVVNFSLGASMRFPAQYRVGSWSEDGVLPPLDAADRSDLGLSASALAATPEEPIVHFTGSH